MARDTDPGPGTDGTGCEGGIATRLTVAGRVLLSACTGVGLVAWSQGAEGTTLLCCLVLSLLVLSRRAARRNLAPLAASQVLEARARAGVPVGAQVTVCNAGPRACEAVHVEQPRPRGCLPAEGRARWARLEPGTTTLACPLTVRTRGEVRLARLVLWSEWPWGLVRAEATWAAPAQVLAWPREGRPTAALRQRLRAGRAPGGRAALVACAPDDLHGVRAWREGDDPRRLHAASSLRRGEPTVADWRERQAEHVAIVLGPHRSAASAPLLERSVSVAASLWSLCQREGLPCSLHVGTQACRGTASYAQGLDLLARVRARAADPLAGALAAAGARGAGSGRIVVVGGPEAGSALAALRPPGGTGHEPWWLDVRAPGLSRYVEGL